MEILIKKDEDGFLVELIVPVEGETSSALMRSKSYKTLGSALDAVCSIISIFPDITSVRTDIESFDELNGLS